MLRDVPWVWGFLTWVQVHTALAEVETLEIRKNVISQGKTDFYF